MQCYSLSIGIDIDPSALAISQANASDLREEVADDSPLAVDWLAADLMSGASANTKSKSKSKLKSKSGARQEDSEAREWLPSALRLGCFDTVLMNPPFGVRSTSGSLALLFCLASFSLHFEPKCSRLQI